MGKTYFVTQKQLEEIISKAVMEAAKKERSTDLCDKRKDDYKPTTNLFFVPKFKITEEALLSLLNILKHRKYVEEKTTAEQFLAVFGKRKINSDFSRVEWMASKVSLLRLLFRMGYKETWRDLRIINNCFESPTSKPWARNDIQSKGFDINDEEAGQEINDILSEVIQNYRASRTSSEGLSTWSDFGSSSLAAGNNE